MLWPLRIVLPSILLVSIAGLVPFRTASSAPSVTSFSPGGGPVGTSVSIRGTGFTSVVSVKFNGIAASYSVISDTLITAFVPGSASTGPIAVSDGTTVSSSPSSFFVGNSPAVSNFNPGGGPVGTAVVINGSSFVGITAVRFNGVAAAFSVNSSNSITATVPPGATTGRISVTNPSGTSQSNSDFYLPPTISSFSPAGGPSGTSVLVHGTSLLITNQVLFNGVAASFSIQDNSRLTAQVPAGATSGPLQVTSLAGTATSGQAFFVGSAPSPAAVDPEGGPPGTSVVIRGSRFFGATGVLFNGTSAFFTVESDTIIHATVPGSATTGLLAIVNPAGSATLPTPFYVGYSPVVSSFSPLSASVGSAVVLTGTGFQAATQVMFSGVPSVFVVGSDTELTATVPVGAQPGPIVVVNPAGSGSSIQNFGVSPKITNLSPASVPASIAVGTAVQIDGYNFQGVFSVTFNGIAASYTVSSDVRITAYVPAGATTGLVAVQSPYGTGSSPFVFDIVVFTPPPPTGPGWPNSPEVNVPVVIQPGSQTVTSIAADSTGGAFITWYDDRDGDRDIYVQRITSFGEVAPDWPVNGLQVCGAPNQQLNPIAMADGVGGVLIVWEDWRNGSSDLYATRVSSNGTRAIGWPLDGLAVSTALNDQTAPVLTSDGASGALIAWYDTRDGNGDVFVHRVLATGTLDPAWPPEGLGVVPPFYYHQQEPAIASDASGGAYVAWRDSRNGYGIFVQRTTSSGTLAPGWPAEGVQVSSSGVSERPRLLRAPGDGVFVIWTNGSAQLMRLLPDGNRHPSWPFWGRYATSVSNGQYNVNAIPDLQGGVLMSWREFRGGGGNDVAAQRIRADATLAIGWPVNALTVCAAPGEQTEVTMTPDGYGGAFVTWQDLRYDLSYDIFAQRVFSSGTIATGWPAAGSMVSVALQSQMNPVITWDGKEGAVIAWTDFRADPDVYAQNIGHSSKLGDPTPRITSIRDVAGDQGGHVRISWSRSYLDTLPTIEISSYGIWREVPEAYAVSAIQKGARLLTAGDDMEKPRPSMFRKRMQNGITSYWEGVASILARGWPSYSYTAETFADSSSVGSLPWTTFMVDAHASFGPYFWTAERDSGYSVDNLPPQSPQGLTGNFQRNSNQLHWRPNLERDFAAYRIHRSNSPSELPSSANLIATTSDTLYTDSGVLGVTYWLIAVDAHGNTSSASVVTSPAVTGVGETASLELRLGNAIPSPAISTVRLSLDLPRSQHVRAQVFDVRGRCVAVLNNSILGTGRHELSWSLRSTSGTRVESGIYFVKVDAPGGRQVRRVVVTE